MAGAREGALACTSRMPAAPLQRPLPDLPPAGGAAESRFSLGLKYMAASAFFFSLMSLLVKLAGQRFPTMELVFARALVVSVLALAVIRVRGVSLHSPDTPLLILRGLFGLAALSCFYYSVVKLPLAVSTVLHFTNPLFTALIAAIFLGEALRVKALGLMLASLAGVVIVAQPVSAFGLPGQGYPLPALAAALAGALLSAAAYTLVRRLRRNDPMVVVFYFAAVSVVLAGPAMIPVAVRPEGWEWALLLGVGVATFLGQMFLTLGLQREPAGRAMSFSYLQIIFAGGWGYLAFAEVPTLDTLLGAGVIVAATVVLGRLRPAGGE